MKFQIKRLIAQIIFLISANLGAFGLKTGFCYPFFYCHACPAATSACPIRAIEVGLHKSGVNVEGFLDFLSNVKWRLIIYLILIIGTVG